MEEKKERFFKNKNGRVHLLKWFYTEDWFTHQSHRDSQLVPPITQCSAPPSCHKFSHRLRLCVSVIIISPNNTHIDPQMTRVAKLVGKREFHSSDGQVRHFVAVDGRAFWQRARDERIRVHLDAIGEEADTRGKGQAPLHVQHVGIATQIISCQQPLAKKAMAVKGGWIL